MAISTASFRLPTSELATRSISLSYLYIYEFLRDGRTPLRALTDRAVQIFAPLLEGPGTIIELGAAGDYYKSFFSASQRYLPTNIVFENELKLNMTDMELPDYSVDAFVSIYVLEHIFDYEKSIKEIYRCLKSCGRLLLIVPFLYYYHGAPEDYFRFTKSCLKILLSNFSLLFYLPIGNRELFIAEALHEKRILGSNNPHWKRLLLRLIACPFLIKGIYSKKPNDQYTIAHLFLVEKAP